MKHKCIIIFLFIFTIAKSFGQDLNFDEGLKSFDSKDYKKAFELLKPYAEAGNCLAQFVIGFSYQYGLSVEKNESIATHWLEMSAEQKQPTAMGPLAANLFAQGDKIKAYLWAMLAAEYVESQKYTTTRYVIKAYMKNDEIETAEKLIENYKNKWKDKEVCR